MKKLFIGMLIVLMASTSVYAANGDSMCEGLSSMAETLMSARQSGVPMEKSMAVVKRMGIKNLITICKSMVIEAYEEPRWATEEYKKRAIEDFRDKVYLRCVKAYNK